MLPIINANQAKKGSKAMSLFLGMTGVIVMLVIICVGALLAGHIWNPSWNPFKQINNSDKVVRDKILQQIRR